MAQYSKSIGGAWVKASELKNGAKCKIVSETAPHESSFTNKDGTPKKQDVAKIRFDGAEEAMNVSLNRATIYGLIDAFGTESKEWIGKELTVHTEKVVVGGKRVTALYLVAPGFKVAENAEGYVEIKREGEVGDAYDKVFDGSEQEAVVEIE